MKNSLKISEKIRESFCTFFKSHDHKLLPSSSLIPENDPTLLFTNAGMVQFKNFFTGQEVPKKENIISIQKCLRAGGKHNDLENVGYTPRHHTFFEMLGNFSFGGYFKELAIELAWNFLVKELNIPKNKLVVTHHKDDEEAKIIWKKISGFSEEKIISIKSEDNFWSMGDSGPCGPCSEIFFDNGKNVSGGLPGTSNQDGERFVEIWNLVFMEYQKSPKGLKKLSKKCVDTGMGLERITALISGKKNNYETDLFEFIFDQIEKITKVKINDENKINFRIISDHIKSICMLMSDGIIPSNDGRGYVLRRIIRRAVLQANKIKKDELLLNQLVPSIVKKYAPIYFDLEKSKNFILENLKNEEVKFSETLNIGLSILKNELKDMKGKMFSPQLAFKLYDTYGFPIDVTKNILNEQSIQLDLKEYFKIIEESKLKQKSSWVGSGEKSQNSFFLQLKNKFKETNFLGYQQYSVISKLESIIHKNKILNNINTDEENFALIFDKTPFYAESGGQVGDSGEVYSPNGDLICNIKDTIKIDGNIFMHLVEKNKVKKKISIQDDFLIKVNINRRKKIRNNHSATHLLHESLRIVLGDHVGQKGSLVNEKKLRFDFTYNKALTNEQIQTIESMINKTIRSNCKRVEKYMPVKEALKDGAVALFGEKYPEEVRVISFTSKENDNSIDSKELCGGTHVDSTGQIGLFKILSDSSVASGIRRIEAVTGEEAESFFNKKLFLIENIKSQLKATDDNIIDKVKLIQTDLNKLKKESHNKITFSKDKILNLNPAIYFDSFKGDSKELKNFSDQIKKNFSKGIIVLLNSNNNKLSLVVSITENLQENYDAVEILKKIVNFLGGKGGGGRKDLAQGGAPMSEKLDEVEKYLVKLF